MEDDRNQTDAEQGKQLRQEIIETRENMASKLEEITERADNARSKFRDAREKFSPRHHVREHPWLMVGLSALAGFAAYRLLHSRQANQVTTRRIGGAARQVAGRARQGAQVAKGAALAFIQNAQHGATAVRNLMDASPLVRGAVETAARTALTTLGGIVLGSVYERLSQRFSDRSPGHRGHGADDQDEVVIFVGADEAAHGTINKDMAEEIPYEEISAPAAVSAGHSAEQ